MVKLVDIGLDKRDRELFFPTEILGSYIMGMCCFTLVLPGENTYCFFQVGQKQSISVFGTHNQDPIDPVKISRVFASYFLKVFYICYLIYINDTYLISTG